MPNNNDNASNQTHPFHFSQLFAILPFLANHSSNKIKIYRERKNKKRSENENILHLVIMDYGLFKDCV